MLFNSYQFIFLFLPITALGFFALGKYGLNRLAISWLLLASLFFYSWWNPIYFFLIFISIVFNFTIAKSLERLEGQNSSLSRALMMGGVAANLALLGYYKYTNFFIDTVNGVWGTSFPNYKILLPLGISFFTFQQIAYIVDAYNGKTKKYNFRNYALFVTFFPHLIAGPIVHNGDIIPQFSKKEIFRFNPENFAVGMAFFTFGLFKKIMLADNLAAYASPIFQVARDGHELSFLAAWVGALCYTFQIYFDFSGYSDMAIGLGRIFGIKLPLNFNSPYKSTGIIEFWRRWHISLSQFLKEYLYIPLGGNQKGAFRRSLNLMIVMFLGGMWHGANWTFIIWGTCHGLLLILNNAWRELIQKNNWVMNSAFHLWLSRLLTFICVIFLWVLFRSENLNTAVVFLKSMLGMSDNPYADIVININRIMSIVVSCILVWFLPNTQELMRNYRPDVNYNPSTVSKFNLFFRIVWQPTILWSVIVSIIFLVSLFNMMKVSEFLYFQF